MDVKTMLPRPWPYTDSRASSRATIRANEL
jgi:hypothetical protein